MAAAASPPPTLYSDHRHSHLLRGHAWRALGALVCGTLAPLTVSSDPTTEDAPGIASFVNPLTRAAVDPPDERDEWAGTEGYRRLVATALQPNAGLGDLAVLAAPLGLQFTQLEPDPTLAVANARLTDREVLQLTLEAAINQMAGRACFHLALGLSLWDDQPLPVIRRQAAALRSVLHPRGFIVHFADLPAPPQVARSIAEAHPRHHPLPIYNDVGDFQIVLAPLGLAAAHAANLSATLEATGIPADALGNVLRDPLAAWEDPRTAHSVTALAQVLRPLEGVTTVDVNDFAAATIQRALATEGLSVLLSEVLQKQVVMDRDQHAGTVAGGRPDANVFELHRGRPTQGRANLASNGSPLLTDPVMERCAAHVIVATAPAANAEEAEILLRLAAAVRHRATRTEFLPPRPLWLRLAGRLRHAVGR